MIKKDIKLYINVGENSLALRKLMAGHLGSMGIDCKYILESNSDWQFMTIGDYTNVDNSEPALWANNPKKGKEITIAEFFNLTEADLKEPERFGAIFNYKNWRGSSEIVCDLAQEQIDRVLDIFNEGES